MPLLCRRCTRRTANFCEKLARKGHTKLRSIEKLRDTCALRRASCAGSLCNSMTSMSEDLPINFSFYFLQSLQLQGLVDRRARPSLHLGDAQHRQDRDSFPLPPHLTLQHNHIFLCTWLFLLPFFVFFGSCHGVRFPVTRPTQKSKVVNPFQNIYFDGCAQEPITSQAHVYQLPSYVPCLTLTRQRAPCDNTCV